MYRDYLSILGHSLNGRWWSFALFWELRPTMYVLKNVPIRKTSNCLTHFKPFSGNFVTWFWICTPCIYLEKGSFHKSAQQGRTPFTVTQSKNQLVHKWWCTLYIFLAGTHHVTATTNTQIIWPWWPWFFTVNEPKEYATEKFVKSMFMIRSI